MLEPEDLGLHQPGASILSFFFRAFFDFTKDLLWRYGSLFWSFYQYKRKVYLRQLLSGPYAFYKQKDYLQKTIRDFHSSSLVDEVCYHYSSKSFLHRFFERLIALIIFPILIRNFLHILAGKFVILPASTPILMGFPFDFPRRLRRRINFSQNTDWKYKRITVNVNGIFVDGMIMGKESTLNNGRWILCTGGNGEFYEIIPIFSKLSHLAESLNANLISFNYPGIGSSQGFPGKDSMIESYKAFLCLLEDEIEGIGAKEIICWGHSIGAAVQAEAIKTHPLKPDIQYVFVKSRTFSSLTHTAKIITNSFLGNMIPILGWELELVSSSLHLKYPEIVIQTSNNQKEYVNLKSSSAKVVHDGIIPAPSSLANALIQIIQKKSASFAGEKLFIGIPERHNDPINNISSIAQYIDDFLLKEPKKKQ